MRPKAHRLCSCCSEIPTPGLSASRHRYPRSTNHLASSRRCHRARGGMFLKRRNAAKSLWLARFARVQRCVNVCSRPFALTSRSSLSLWHIRTRAARRSSDVHSGCTTCRVAKFEAEKLIDPGLSMHAPFQYMNRCRPWRLQTTSNLQTNRQSMHRAPNVDCDDAVAGRVFARVVENVIKSSSHRELLRL